MIHEERTIEKHPHAKEFRPVRTLMGRLIGWTFEVPRHERDGSRSATKAHGWVTCDGVVSIDILTLRHAAERNLKVYAASQRHGGPEPLPKASTPGSRS